jgi:hypothetical protein
MARTVAEVWRGLADAERARAIVYAQNYGEAAAIEVLGRRHGVPRAYSGHNNYFLWGPPPADTSVILILGGDGEDHRRSCERLELGATVPDTRWAMPYENALQIWICRRLRRPVAEIWPLVRHYE